PMPRLCRGQSNAAVIGITNPKKFHKALNLQGRNSRLALEAYERGVELLQESRTIGLGEGWRAADALPHSGAQVGHDGARRDRGADRRGGEGLARWGKDNCPRLERTVGEQYVGSDHDTARRRSLGDPIVGRIEAIGDEDPLDEWMLGHPQPAVADDL